jgi:DNA polymerase epsilon subunit 1
MTSPVLEFVKFVCTVLGLASDYHRFAEAQPPYLAGVCEFANEVNFRNPCESLKLGNVPCRHCATLHDFDFCRDPELMPHDFDGARACWICRGCGGEYDCIAIEMELVKLVGSLKRALTQQDMHCGKCKQVHSDNVSRYCHCSGPYQLVLGKPKLRRRLCTIVNVAIVHDLSRLRVSYLV